MTLRSVWVAQYTLQTRGFSGVYLDVHAKRSHAIGVIQNRAEMHGLHALCMRAFEQMLNTECDVASSADVDDGADHIDLVINRHGVEDYPVCIKAELNEHWSVDMTFNDDSTDNLSLDHDSVREQIRRVRETTE